jgi:DNA-binding transcriptional ArsR family regulator
MPMSDPVTRYADMFAALGAEPRLRIVRLLLTAHPAGLVVSDIQAETGIPSSTLSHHLDKLKNDELVTAEREKNFIRYRANAAGLTELLSFLYAECCTRSTAVDSNCLVTVCQDTPTRKGKKA